MEETVYSSSYMIFHVEHIPRHFLLELEILKKAARVSYASRRSFFGHNSSNIVIKRKFRFINIIFNHGQDTK